MSFEGKIADTPHFISVIDNNVDLLNTLNDNLSRLEERLRPYSTTPPKEGEGGQNVGMAHNTEIAERFHHLNQEIKHAIDKVERITDNFTG